MSNQKLRALCFFFPLVPLSFVVGVGAEKEVVLLLAAEVSGFYCVKKVRV